eukprot:1137619-Pelagomonas_calceolata.AAC.8
MQAKWLLWVSGSTRFQGTRVMMCCFQWTARLRELPGWSLMLLTSSLPLILWSTRCEGEVGGLFGLVGQGVTNGKIATGGAGVASSLIRNTGFKKEFHSNEGFLRHRLHGVWRDVGRVDPQKTQIGNIPSTLCSAF